MGAGGIGCGAMIAKILLFAFNVCFFLAGAGLMGVGIWIRVDPKSAEFARIISPTSGAGDPLLQAASIVLACVGGFILLVSFLGCCGACCENTCMLNTYATVVLNLAWLQVIAGILAAVFITKLKPDVIGKSMDAGLDKYQSTEALQTAWDSMQVWLECCGRNGSDNWSTSSRSNNGKTYWGSTRWTQDYPPSCCKMKDKDPKKIDESNMEDFGSCLVGNTKGFNTEGCQKKLEDWFRRNAVVIVGIAFGIVAIQFVVAFMACCLKRAIKEEQ